MTWVLWIAWLSRPAAVARADDSPFDAYARWVAYSGTWKGPTVAFPDRTARPPDTPLRLDSTLSPLHVHGPADAGEERLTQALSAAEHTLAWLHSTGWPLPQADGGRGGTPGFDVYLMPSEGGAGAGLDAIDDAAQLDAALTFARVDAHARGERLTACVASAVVQAALLGIDPAEAASLRAASGALVAWLMTGELGCDGDMAASQLHPEAGQGHPAAGEAGAVFLAQLSEREDGGSGSFVRDMWWFARQASGNAARLRASPDLWEAIDRALSNAGESLDELLVDFAVTRFFTGRDISKRPGGYAILGALDDLDPLSPRTSLTLATGKPVHVHAEESLMPLGSSYAQVSLVERAADDQLRIWLRGELGSRWSLAALQLDGNGREVGRLKAPARRVPHAFLPVTLAAGAKQVVIVVTRLPLTIPDADASAPSGAHFKLILEHGPIETAQR